MNMKLRLTNGHGLPLSEAASDCWQIMYAKRRNETFSIEELSRELHKRQETTYTTEQLQEIINELLSKKAATVTLHQRDDETPLVIWSPQAGIIGKEVKFYHGKSGIEKATKTAQSYATYNPHQQVYLMQPLIKFKREISIVAEHA